MKPIKVMSFNCKNYFKTNGSIQNTLDTVDMSISARGPKLNKMILGEAVDIVGFQEMGAPWQEWLEQSLDCSYAYVGGHTQRSGEGGYIAYLKDRFTPIEWKVFWLSEGAPEAPENSWGSKYDRICTWVLFRENTSDEYFLLADFHLDHVNENKQRDKQATLVVEQMMRLKAEYEAELSVSNMPVVMTCDANSEATWQAYKNIVGSGKFFDSLLCSSGETVSEKLSSSPDWIYYESEADFKTDSHRIDYIFVTENVSVLNYSMIHSASNLCKYGAYISDHNAIFAEILMPCNKGESK